VTTGRVTTGRVTTGGLTSSDRTTPDRTTPDRTTPDRTTAGGPPRDERFVLAVDLGTGGPKLGLVSVVGQVAWQDHIPVQTKWLDGGGAVQDAAEWWQIVSDATRRALATGTVRPDQVVAVSVTGQWASTVPVDAGGIPVSDCVMWMDTRGGPHVRRIIGGPLAGYAPMAAAAWLRRSGVPPSTAGDDTLGHMLHLDRDQPAVARAARWYLEPVDYLTMRFTGVAAASPASMTAAWLTDTRRPDIRDYDPVLVIRSGVDPAKLPPLHPTGALIGEVHPGVASQLGIPATARVVTGTPDLHSAAVGAGAVGDYEPNLAIGTTSWISCPVERKRTDPLHQLATVPGLTPDRYLLVNNQDTAGRSFEWLRDNIVSPDDGLLPAGEHVGYGALVELAATAPPGSGNVIFTPWLTGERAPIADRHARGGFHNLSLSTTRAHLARAVLEGVAFNSRWLLDATERFTRRRLEPIRLIGGGAQADLWAQILADVLNRRVERVAEPLHANLRGAAMFAGMALGQVERSEIRSLVAVDRVFRPTPANREVYDRLFAEFPGLYKNQKGLFSRLNPLA
jgi:xylulokinase